MSERNESFIDRKLRTLLAAFAYLPEIKSEFAEYDETERIDMVVELRKDELELLDLKRRERSGDLDRSQVAVLRKVEEVACENEPITRMIKEATGMYLSE